jgi:hypothetical protein
MFAQSDKKFEENAPSIQDKLKFDFEFNASVLSADSDGVVDSMTDAGFNEDETKIGISYEDELWGASAAFKFGNENLRFLSGEIGEMFGPSSPLSLDELYGWIKPFGKHFKFTGGVFENTDGLAGYTDDIDDFSLGVFLPGEDGEPFSEPEPMMTSPSLTDGFLTDLIFGSLTLQLLLAANYSGESASALASDLLTKMTGSPISVDTDQRFFRVGGRLMYDAGVGTVSALFKTFQWPTAIENYVAPNRILSGSKQNYSTFGAYFDLNSIENLGLSLGYTGFITAHDADDADNTLYSGIDLRLTWTGIEGISLSIHNNISFAKGSEKEWMGLLSGTDASVFTMYNAIGATKEITERFSVNAEIMNIFAKHKTDITPVVMYNELEHDNFAITTKFIANVGENAEFNAGLRLDVTKTAISTNDVDEDDTVTTFSIPIGIVISF